MENRHRGCGRDMLGENCSITLPHSYHKNNARRCTTVLTLVNSFSDFLGLRVGGDTSVQRRLVQRPTILPARRLDQSREIGLGNVESRQPDHVGLVLSRLYSIITSQGWKKPRFLEKLLAFRLFFLRF